MPLRTGARSEEDARLAALRFNRGFQEGIRFPALKLFAGGVRQDIIFEIIKANVRLPKMSLGDLNAELASVRIADARLEEISRKYGIDRLSETFDHILTTSERLSRAAIAAMPDGTYLAEDWIDGDGISNQRFPVKVAVTIKGDKIVADFTGSSRPAGGTGELHAWSVGLRREDCTQGRRQSDRPFK